MELYKNEYYHIFNRTNNEEALFRSRENYLYFLKKYRYYLEKYFDTIAYCLMPTHYHFLVRIKEAQSEVSDTFKVSDTCSAGKDVRHLEGVGHLKTEHLKNLKGISRAMQTFQSSYTKAINKKYNRHGSLFAQHYNAKHIEDENYFITLAFYIHQNPVRSILVDRAEEWEFSSCQDYLDIRKGNLPNKELILERFTIDEIKDITKNEQGVIHLK